MWPANLTTASRGSGDHLRNLASSTVQIGAPPSAYRRERRWRGRRTRSWRLSRARASSCHCHGRRCSRGSSWVSWGETLRRWEEGEWFRGVVGRLLDRLEEEGRQLRGLPVVGGLGMAGTQLCAGLPEED